MLVKRLAAEAGFHRCGIARAEAIGRADYLRTWLAAGRAGSMSYLHRHLEKRTNPQTLLEGARSVIVVALLYDQPSRPPRASRPPTENDRARNGQVAMYAWGDDYHTIMKDKLLAMVERLRTELSCPFDAKICVDTSPLLEREVAAAAGIGWIGKNTMVLDHQLGSFFFLGEVVTTLELTCDEPLTDRCGTCTACLEACPTGAFPAPYEMDASRCISYLTIEHRGDIAPELQDRMGRWVFGCDVCQEVCPYNRHALSSGIGAPSSGGTGVPSSSGTGFQPVLSREPGFAIREPGPNPSVDEILGWTIDDYRSKLRGSAMKRAKLGMLQRNARIAGNNIERASRQT